MIAETLVPQSAGSLSVAVLALMMVIIQITFLFRKTKLAWYGWSATLSFASMLYAVGIFLEYNTPAGFLNRVGGLLEFTAHVLLVQSIYGFSFAYLEIQGRKYLLGLGIINLFFLGALWFSDNIVAAEFVSHNFSLMTRPFVEAALGPWGPFFELYITLASLFVIILWFVHKNARTTYRILYLAGMLFWFALGIHDGLVSLGMPAVQYLMEYGFLGFSMVVLWSVFNSYLNAEAEGKYRMITELVKEGIMMIQDGKVVFANPACNVITNRSVIDSSINALLNDVVSEENPAYLFYYNQLLKAALENDTFLIRIGKLDEAKKVVAITASIVCYRSKSAILAILRDITEKIRKEEALKESEEKLARLKKMESLGLLAGGVAHDLNNVLSGIVSYPELLLLNLPEDSKLRKPIETIKKSGQRAADIVEDLLTVARGVAVSKEPLNLNEVISEYLRSPEYKKLLNYHSAITVRVEPENRLLNIRGSVLHVRKVVMNLVSNASEAIEGLGEVVITTQNRYLDRPLKGYDDLNTGEYVVLTVADNGPGISPEDMQRIFEPFYTKKVMGRSGTGLGLTVVWNVVRGHEGYIDVCSDKRGTKFEIYFPATRESVANAKPTVSGEIFYGNGEKVLVVDDVPSQREIFCLMLETLRYKAVAVSRGEEAVEYVRKHKVDLLLLDMIMDPGINGRETYERIKKINPRQKAIIVSGFAQTDQVNEALQMGAGRYLKKPLVLEELGAALKEELSK